MKSSGVRDLKFLISLEISLQIRRREAMRRFIRSALEDMESHFHSFLKWM